MTGMTLGPCMPKRKGRPHLRVLLPRRGAHLPKVVEYRTPQLYPSAEEESKLMSAMLDQATTEWQR